MTPNEARPAETGEAIARIIDPYAWRCYDATLRPFLEGRGAHEGESWHVRAYQAGCRNAEDARRWWLETADSTEPYTVQQLRQSLTKAEAIAATPTPGKPVDLGADAERGASEACPFCGISDSFVERADFSSCYVTCNGCGARGPTSCDENSSDADASDSGDVEPGELPALRLWKRRTPPASVDATIERCAQEAEQCRTTALGRELIGHEAARLADVFDKLCDEIADRIRALSATPTHPDQALPTTKGEA